MQTVPVFVGVCLGSTKPSSRVISVLPFLVLDPKEAWGMVAHTHCGSLGENAVPTIGSYICTLSP